MSTARTLACAVFGLAWLCAKAVPAQGLRDPTAPPALDRPVAPVATPVAAASGAARSAGTTGAMGIIVRDGKPKIMQGTRLYGVGELLGAARIECITETQVWLREGGELRKLDQFNGIVRQADPPPRPPAPVAPPTEAARVSRLAKPASAPKIEASSVACGNRQP